MPCTYVVRVGISLKFIHVVVLVTVASAISQHICVCQQFNSRHPGYLTNTRYQQLEYSYHRQLHSSSSIITTAYSITFKHCYQITRKLLCTFEILSVYSIWSWHDRHDFTSVLWRFIILPVRYFSILKLDFQLKQLLFNRICIWKFYYRITDLKTKCLNVVMSVMYDIGYRLV
jgi:hypothetical protein